MKRILSWFSASSSDSLNTSQTIYPNLSDSEKKEIIIKSISSEDIYRTYIEKCRSEIKVLTEQYKKSDSKERKKIQNQINILETNIYDYAHQINLAMLERHSLEKEIDPENEF